MEAKKNSTGPVPAGNREHTQSLPNHKTEQAKSERVAPKQRMTRAEASRQNGRKSPGPNSADGKQKSRMNALKDGLFSKEAVVTAAGERVKDFERFEAWLWDSVQPGNAIEAILTNDVVVNWWGRQRVRRCQSAALQNRLENLTAHDYYLRSDQIEPLKIQFSLALDQYRILMSSPQSSDFHEIVTELEDARRRLASTSLGLEFLLKEVNAVKEEAESKCHISWASQLALYACAGLTNDLTTFLGCINGINIRESAKAAERVQAEQRGGIGHTKDVETDKHKQNTGQREVGEWDKAGGKFMLVSVIDMIASELKLRKQVLEAIEKWYDKTRVAASVLPADGTCDRFARAETAYDRRLYRALAALHAIKQAEDKAQEN